MAALVDEIVALEAEADNILAQANAEAKGLVDAAHAEIVAYRQQLALEVEERLAAFRGDMEKHHKDDLGEAEAELAAALNNIDRIREDILHHQVNRIIARFSEW
jgi:hypothetical protein